METLNSRHYEVRHHHHEQVNPAKKELTLNSRKSSILTFETKVKGGALARRHQFPFLVLIQRKNALMRLGCSGSILSSRWILTAAHCFYLTEYIRLSPRSLRVKAGALRLAENYPYYRDVQTRQVMRLVQHPNYYRRDRPFRLYNDIGLVRLRSPLRLDSKSVVPIKLPHKGQKISGDLVVPGFAGYADRPVWPQLYFIEMPIISKEECARNISHTSVPRNMLEKVFCTMPSFGQSACRGDSGGPVIYPGDKAYVVGIVSWLPTGNCDNDRLDAHMHTDVREHLDFIYQHVHDFHGSFVLYSCPN